MGGLSLDFPALFIIAVQSGLLCWGIKESTSFNNIVTGVNLACIAFVLLAGFSHIDPANFRPYAPYGASGVLSAASICFFSFVGFDAVATAAEEAKNPGRDLPIGIIGSLTVCSVLYAAMSATICGMVHYTELDLGAPFAVAFDRIGMRWAGFIVSAGASTGITTSLLVALLGQPRIYMAMARDGLLPAWFAAVDGKRGTPLNSTIVTGVSAGLLALLIDIDLLAQVVSIGTLCVFAAVCAALLMRRYAPTEGGPRAPVLWRIVALSVACGFGAATAELMKEETGGVAYAVPALLLAVAAAASLARMPMTRPKRFAVPFVPWVPALGIFSCMQLIASLGPIAWIRFVVFYTVCVGVYCAYRGGHHSDDAIREGGKGDGPAEEEAGGIELESRPLMFAEEAAGGSAAGGGSGVGRVWHGAAASAATEKLSPF